jgi:hypothetical protein
MGDVGMGRETDRWDCYCSRGRGLDEWDGMSARTTGSTKDQELEKWKKRPRQGGCYVKHRERRRT